MKIPQIKSPCGWVVVEPSAQPRHPNEPLSGAELATTQLFLTRAEAEAWIKQHELIWAHACPLENPAIKVIRQERNALAKRVAILGSRVEDITTDRDKWKALARESK